MKSNAISKSVGRIYCLGEALWDILFEDNCCLGGHVGGAMLNTAVTLGRAGVPVEFISLLASDRAGVAIQAFLSGNGVGTGFVQTVSALQSTLALAFINIEGDAEYSFYKSVLPEVEFAVPDFQPGDLLLFGSGWAREEKIFPRLHYLLREARRKEVLTVYDPNFRKKGASAPAEVEKMCRQNIAAADLVRGSDEDFFNLFGCQSGQAAYQQVRSCGCDYLIYTVSSSRIELYTPRLELLLPVEAVQVVNTVGAGDNFNAGLLAEFYKNRIKPVDLPLMQRSDWENALRTARGCGSAVCTIKENYLPPELAEKLLK